MALHWLSAGRHQTIMRQEKNMHGPQLAFSEALHAQKYRGEGESFREAMNRVASALQDDEEHYKEFREMLLDMRFMPAGRVQSAMGSTRDVTPYNCFVSGTIEDSAVDGHGSIMDRAKEAFATMRKGGGIGYDFSTLRPNGAMIKKLQSQASGPVSFMDIFDAVCKCVSSSGHRRGAQMGVLRVDHPDIEEFIHVKQNSNRLTKFNISIAVTDEFMEAVRDGKMFQLRWGGEVYKEIDARALWEMIMRSTWDWAEPGVLFIDQINRMNNLYYCETIAATNPCVPAGTRILTTHGWQPIEELCEQTIEVWNGEQWSMVKPRPTGRNQQLLEVSLSNGQHLSCTMNHDFYLSNGTRVPAQDLKVGEELLDLPWPVIPGGVNVEAAYTQGCFAGDGWYASYRYLYLKDKLPAGKFFVPGTQWSVQSRLDWLAGLIDTDGTAIWSYTATGERSSCSVAISSVNEEFIDDVALMLRTLGVSTNRDVDTRQNAWSASAACHRIALRSSQVKLLQELGLETHRVNLIENNPRSTNKVRLVVENVTRGQIADTVFCFTEPLASRGCFDGILTAQCGEQPLPPYGACLLGSINLVKYLRAPDTVHEVGDGSIFSLDLEQLDRDIPIIIRAMDNIVDRARYPMYEQEKEAKAKRRMGIGVTGLANAIEALGHPYGSAEFLEMEDRILERLCHQAYRASAMLAMEKGPFPLYDPQAYLSGAFIQTLPEDIRDLIREHGIRNSHLTSIAPTGTISWCADNVSSGIEPVFADSFDRVVIGPEGSHVETVQDYGSRVLGVHGRCAAEVTVRQHLDVLAVAYRHVDSAVAKTCNVSGDVSWADFKQIYMDAWERGCKGCTTFRIDGKRDGILSINENDGAASEPSTDDEGSSCYVDPSTGRRECE